MVDEDVLVAKLEYVDEYTTDLEQMRDLPKDEYLDDTVTKRAVERTLMNLIQSCIDLAAHVRATEGLAPEQTSKEDVAALGNAGIISQETRERMEEAVGMRNLLAHRYGDVDHEVVYDVLHDDLHWFERFQQEVAEWYRRRQT